MRGSKWTSATFRASGTTVLQSKSALGVDVRVAMIPLLGDNITFHVTLQRGWLERELHDSSPLQ